MKKVLFFVFMIGSASYVKSQELVFKMNQFASASKNNASGRLKDAEVKDIQSTIFFSARKVLIEGDVHGAYTLHKKGAQTKINDHVVSYSYNGTDENMYNVSFVYTINLESKEAVVEIAYNKMKDYYFGTFSSSDLTMQR